MVRAQKSRVDLVLEELAGLSEAELDDLRKRVSANHRLRSLLRSGGDTEKKHSILELEGLGAEFWRSIDVDAYIRQERESWR